MCALTDEPLVLLVEFSVSVDDVLGGLLEGADIFGAEVLVFDGLDELIM